MATDPTPEVKGLQFETNESPSADFPRDSEVKGLQFETDASATGVFPREVSLKGIMFETNQTITAIFPRTPKLKGILYEGNIPPPPPPEPLPVIGDFIGEVISRRGTPRGQGFSHNFVELFGGMPVILTPHEPDPNTFREGFYYNTRENRLFKKLRLGNQFVWKPVDND
jgi:hypothetical protein